MSFWAAARFDPHRSELALRHLAAQGFEAYLPKTRERVVTPYRDVERTTSLFPGYLFVRIELQWRPVQMSLGIRALVMLGGAPARMQDHLIAALRALEHDGLVIVPHQPKPERFNVGDPVHIRRGALGGQTGLYAGMNGHQRIAVLMTLFGSEHSILIPMADIDDVPAPPRRRPRHRPGREHRRRVQA
jgi:transcriptional antiterminator RfaH